MMLVHVMPADRAESRAALRSNATYAIHYYRSPSRPVSIVSPRTPKELQLISRQTDKQVKKLARKYRAGNRIHRVEPFEDNAAPIQKINHGILADQSK